jgi:hypothetical protein
MPDLSVRLLINLFSIAGALFAIWKGNRAERTAGAIVILNALVGEAGHWLTPSSESVVRLINDGLTAFALLAVTIRYAALWMGGVMLFFAAQFTLHSYYLVTERPTDFLHSLVNNIDWSAITWCLIIGTAVAWRRRVRLARNPDESAA